MGNRRNAASLVGVGLYTIPRAAQILRVPTPKLRRWAQGYTFGRGESVHRMGAVVAHELDGLHEAGMISFLDLVELLFVRAFRFAGVSLPVIRRAAERAREIIGVTHPFAAKRFATDGRFIFADLITPKRWKTVLEEMHTGQRVFREVVEPFFRTYLNFDGDVVDRYMPPEGRGLIVLDPKRRSGAPFVKSVGIETEILAACEREWGSPEAVAHWYDIPVEAVSAAVKYESAIRAA